MWKLTAKCPQCSIPPSTHSICNENFTAPSFKGWRLFFQSLNLGVVTYFGQENATKMGCGFWTKLQQILWHGPLCSTRPLKLPYEYARATLWGMSDAVEESTVVPAKALSGQPTASQPEHMRERRAHQRSAELPPQPIADSWCLGKPSLDHRVTEACLKC